MTLTTDEKMINIGINTGHTGNYMTNDLLNILPISYTSKISTERQITLFFVWLGRKNRNIE